MVPGVEVKNFVSLQHMRREIHFDKRHPHSTKENSTKKLPPWSKEIISGWLEIFLILTSQQPRTRKLRIAHTHDPKLSK